MSFGHTVGFAKIPGDFKRNKTTTTPLWLAVVGACGQYFVQHMTWTEQCQ